MAPVFREVKLHYGGKDYRLVPSNRLLRRIEMDGDLSLLSISQSASKGKVQISAFAFVLAVALQEAGCKVTEDQMLIELTDPSQAKSVLPLAQQVFAALLPQPDGDPGKPVAPVKRRR
jgi:hypothetical protein